MKNIPQRTCMGCNAKKDKKDLIRIVKKTISTNVCDTESNSSNQKINEKYEITIDKTGKLEGRGAYICNSVQCLEKAIKCKRIERALNVKISVEIYSDLKKMINGGEFIG